MLICRKVEYLNFRCKATIRHQVALLDGVISKICKNGKMCRHLQILPILHPTTQCWLMSLSEKRTEPKQGNEDDFLWQISRLKVKPMRLIDHWKLLGYVWNLWLNNSYHEHRGKRVGLIAYTVVKTTKTGWALCIPTALNPAAMLAVKLPSTKTTALLFSAAPLHCCTVSDGFLEHCGCLERAVKKTIKAESRTKLCGRGIKFIFAVTAETIPSKWSQPDSAR